MEKARHIELRAEISRAKRYLLVNFLKIKRKRNFFKKRKKHRVENRSIRRHFIRETNLHLRLSKFESIRCRKEFSFSSILCHPRKIYKIYIVTIHMWIFKWLEFRSKSSARSTSRYPFREINKGKMVGLEKSFSTL